MVVFKIGVNALVQMTSIAIDRKPVAKRIGMDLTGLMSAFPRWYSLGVSWIDGNFPREANRKLAAAIAKLQYAAKCRVD